MLFTTVVFAIAMPNVSLVISFIGALCISMLGFILPALIGMCVNHQYPDEYANMCTNNGLLLVLLVFGIIALIIGVASSVLDVIHYFST